MDKNSLDTRWLPIQNRERMPFWWEREGYDERFDWHRIIDADVHGH